MRRKRVEEKKGGEERRRRTLPILPPAMVQCFGAKTIRFGSGSRFHEVSASVPSKANNCEHNIFI
jgi:hypothetical protein